MPRQSISFTEKNDEWLRNQIETEGEFTNKSDLVNDLIRRARRAEAINKKLAKAELSGFTNQSKTEMLSEFKSKI